MSIEECDMMKAINKVREDKGLNPLQALAKCVEAAGDHAEDMVKRGYFSHNSPDESWSDRMGRYGLKGTYVGENIAYGNEVSGTVRQWMNSPGHRKNILRPQYKSSGIGYAITERGRRYWVQCFAGFKGDNETIEPSEPTQPAQPTQP
jgi:uncharacterized protein YkwD